MASLGHVAVGLAVGRAYAAGEPGRRWWAMGVLALLALAPDLDVVSFSLGIPYEHALGHRGASHSLSVALAAAAVGAWWARGRGLPPGRTFAAVAVGSHGLLDALTDGGLGAALLWPLSGRRFFAPFRPLPVAPLGFDFLSSAGLGCALAELRWFSPLLLFAFWPRASSPREPR